MADSLLSLIIISGGVVLYLSTIQAMNHQLVDSRIKMERSRAVYEKFILQLQ